MKVLNLRCDQEHRFEGWFASELDYQSQQERAVLACPVCDSKQVQRLPSAPRVQVSRSSASRVERRSEGDRAASTRADDDPSGAAGARSSVAPGQRHPTVRTAGLRTDGPGSDGAGNDLGQVEATREHPAPSSAPDSQLAAQARWLQAVQQVLRTTEDVGERFPEEARRIHYGEVKERAIRGQASAEDAEALREEGIAVAALPLPSGWKGPIQ